MFTILPGKLAIRLGGLQSTGNSQPTRYPPNLIVCCTRILEVSDGHANNFGRLVLNEVDL
jgi:hypothetical protein